MTREEIFSQCVQKIDKTNTLLLEAATGTGKTAISIRLVNHIFSFPAFKKEKEVNILILVAKVVHKQTWIEEIEKWGGIHHPKAKINVRMECYESLHKCLDLTWDIVIADEVHHIGSELRLELLEELTYKFFVGLSATIPRKLKQFFKYNYHSQIVSCDLVEAIDSNILPEPQILLLPLKLNNIDYTETFEINAKASGNIYYGNYRDLWKYKRAKVHAILSCTQKQKSNELNALIQWEKNKFMQTHNEAIKQSWLFHAGKRLEFYADCKLNIIRTILKHLNNYRTITFCKTIEQAENIGEGHCIHSKNEESDEIYKQFNQKKIDHITAVNILNENANLVDCKYAIFCNLSSSEVSVPQRIGRSLRHKSPVIIVPFYAGTREEELVEKMIEGFNKEYIKVIHGINEI